MQEARRNTVLTQHNRRTWSEPPLHLYSDDNNNDDVVIQLL